MPFTLANFTDAAGNAYPASHWRLHELHLLPAQRLARVTFHAFKDADAAAAGKAPVGSRVYTLRGADFDRAYTALIAGHVTAAVEQLVLAQPELPDPKDPHRRVSFFAAAQQAPPPAPAAATP